MTHPTVDFILDAIKTNWSAGTFSDIPLERIDRDNSEILAGNVRSHTEDLQRTNYVGVAYQNRDVLPIGTGYDHDIEVVAGVRIEGLHTDEFGKVDPNVSLPPTSANDPVPWHDLVDEIRDTILAEKSFPDTGQSDIDFTDLQIVFEDPGSTARGDYYRHDIDVGFNGYEEL